MYKYVFTNDFRLYDKQEFERNVKHIANQINNGIVPQEKSENNVFNAYRFFLSLKEYQGTVANGVKRILNNDIESVLHNFISKFQYPNKRTKTCLKDSVEKGVEFVPLRTILKLLYLQYVSNGEDGYLTKEEILHFVFYNRNLVFNRHINLIEVLHEVKTFREDKIYPRHIEADYFSLEQRHFSNFIGVLLYSNFVVKNDDRYSINACNFTGKTWSNFLKIIMNNSFLNCTVDTTDDDYFAYMDIEKPIEQNDQLASIENTEITMEKDSKRIDKPHNRILFGAPGTGKSHILEEDRLLFGGSYERVTFHPNYSYAQFVGMYKPKPKFKENGEEYISYEFVPGPFLRVWINSMLSKKAGVSTKHLLIIEEINRANVAAVFGDVFQLLDRNGDGKSQYGIAASEDIKEYLQKEWSFTQEEVQEILLPDNMYLWATMNSADQGVYPIDTAFKRRWNFEYISIDEGEDSLAGITVDLTFEKEIPWNLIRKAINKRLTDSDLKVNEDKLIGPFFINKSDLMSENFNEIFKSKLLMYLFEDVLKHKNGKFFDPNLGTFSKIIKAYDSGQNIFDFSIKKAVTYQVNASSPYMLVAENLGED